MEEDLDGGGPHWAERTQQVAGRLSIKPVDDVSFTKHDKGLQRGRSETQDKCQTDGSEVRETSHRDRSNVRNTSQRSERQVKCQRSAV